MSYKIIGQRPSGNKVLVDPSTIGGANVVIPNVPCLSSVYVGAAVIMNTGGTASNAIATSLATSNVIGIVEFKPSLNQCNIRVIGVSLGIFVGLDVVKEYYLSDTIEGLITTTIPTASGSIMLKLGQPFSATEFLVTKGQSVVRL
tara:strand:- start:923 stop:1357 length:435 start_codon:yes stop_codon:yes gene_type:complete